jgi:hypothetical protein
MADKIIIDPTPAHPDGVLIGSATTKKIGFHGVAPSAQRSGAAQAAVATEAITGAAGSNPSQAEYATAVARINALTALTNELRAALVEKGIIKGAA